MNRIYLPYLLEFSKQMDVLSRLPTGDADFFDVFIDLYAARDKLNQLHAESLYITYLRTAAPLYFQLRESLNKVLNYTARPEKVSSVDIYTIRSSYEEYKIALFAALGAADVYLVSQKGPYDNFSLLMFGENLFPADLVRKAPEAVFDAKEAGKCLAFELPTACGFHLFRATESVLRRYYTHVTGGQPRPKARNIGAYIRKMRALGCGDPIVLAALEQMANLHRNPIVHPEAVLTVDESLAIAGIARSAVTAMLSPLPVEPLTTTAVSIPTVPDS